MSGSRRSGRGSSVRATSIRFDDDNLWVGLSDGRVLGVPLAWFPRLLRASPEQREGYRMSSRGEGMSAASATIRATRAESSSPARSQASATNDDPAAMPPNQK